MKAITYMVSIDYLFGIPKDDKRFVSDLILRFNDEIYEGSLDNTFLCTSHKTFEDALIHLHRNFAHIKDIAHEILIYHILDIEAYNFDAIFDKTNLN